MISRFCFTFLVVSMLGFGLAGQAQNADDLSAKLTRGAKAQQQITQLFLELSTMKDDICSAFQAYLPKDDSPFAAYTWECHYTDGTIRYSVRDARQQRVASVQILYYPDGVTAAARGMRGKCLDMPAMRTRNRKVWALVSDRLELRVDAQDESLKSDEKLDAFVAAFDLAAMKAL